MAYGTAPRQVTGQRPPPSRWLTRPENARHVAAQELFDMGAPIAMATNKEPKTWIIPSRDWGVSADEAAGILVQAEEVKKNKDLYKAAIATLKNKKKSIDEIV